jgi:hypothetical protein
VTAKTPTLCGECRAINDDGSFWISTSKAMTDSINEMDAQLKTKIDCYDSTLTLLTTCDYSEHNNQLTQPIVFHDDLKKIKPFLDKITPLQYNLIKKACNTPREKNSLLSIKKDSFDHHTLQSFGVHKKLLIDILKLQITS